ncbi:Gag polyprotein [Operophtera brumata]|uniref:Gag polyprotein n=1 Tax=Operophtera brumata TaxID=104452 RepID=A0A0L7KW42_OPEBR|nr:Gag polyprotein [Operophtera brumata]
MAYSVKFLSLQKSELEYEVHIRGTVPGLTVQDLRKQITKLGPLFPSEDILTSPFEVAEDLSGVVGVLEKVNASLDSAALDKNTVLRARNLLNHLYHRLNRIAGEDGKEHYEQCVNLYKKATVKLDSVSESALDPLATTSSDLLTTPVNSILPVSVTVTCDGNSENKFSKLKYDGKNCVRAFIQRVDEFSLAKNISREKLLKNATEIFTGDAIHWYRSIGDSVSTWDELAVLLRRDFGQSDYDYRLLSQIRSRTQGETENIVIYLSIMSGLFLRLSKTLSEEDKLEILLHNIRPCYASTLSSVSEIKTVEELRTLCRNYEGIQSRLSQFREPPRPTSDTLAPEFAYSGPANNKQNSNFNRYHNYNRHNNNNIDSNKSYPSKQNTSTNGNAQNSVHAMDSSNQRPRYCPRCRTDTHNLRQCTANKEELVCYVCGRKGVKTPDCPDCVVNKKPLPKN